MSEASPLIGGPAAPALAEAEESRRSSRVVTLLASAMVLLGFAAVGARNSGVLTPRSMAVELPGSAGSAGSAPSIVDISDSARVQCYNGYTEQYGFAAKDYVWLEKGKLVEPYKRTMMVLKDVPDDVMDSVTQVVWKATHTGNLKTLRANSQGSTLEIDMQFEDVGQYDLVVTMTLEDGSQTQLVDKVWCRYVRRNIRNLDTEDLANYLDAALVLHQTPLEEGIATYGEYYTDITSLVRTHRESAIPNKENDRMHDGLGFLTQHIAVSSAYEFALQVINPSVSLPYWDFTEDWAYYNQTGEGARSMWDLDVWHEDYFGTSLGSEIHAITTGRFAYVKVPLDKDRSLASYNAYGTLRSPWNLNSSPYVTRIHQVCGFSYGNGWPSCDAHYKMAFHSNTLTDLVSYASYDAHAGVHGMVGGTAGCEDWKDLANLTQGMGHIKDMAIASSFVLRNIWRYSICSVPETCSFDAPDDTCKLECNGCGEEGFIQKMIVEMNVWWDSPVWSEMPGLAKEVFTDKIFCSGTKWYVGDHLEGSSPSDVSFWPIHPTLERLVQYKNFVSPLKETQWNASGNSVGWDTYCKWGKEFGTDCYGHHPEDLTAFKMTFLASTNVTTLDIGGLPATIQTGHLTNSEVSSLSDPHNSVFLPYVYENFEWKHCNELGYDFPNAHV